MSTLATAPSVARWRGFGTLRGGLFLLLVLIGIAQLAGAGRDVRADRLVEDLQQGRTQTVLVMSDRVIWRSDQTLNLELPLPLTSWDRSQLDLDRELDFSTAGVTDAAGVRTFLSSHTTVTDSTVRELPRWLNPSGLQKTLHTVAFLMLLLGPAPWRFNRWGWFWLLVVLPYGLGGAAFLLGSGPSPLRSQPSAHRRQEGGDGCLLAIVIVVLGSLLLLGVQQLFPAPRELVRTVVHTPG